MSAPSAVSTPTGLTVLRWIEKNPDPLLTEIVAALRSSKADVLVNFLPVGSQKASEFYMECALEAGVAVVNAGTYGSEPHMPFGGLKQSGNGWREPGREALDVYSDVKDIYINIDPKLL